MIRIRSARREDCEAVARMVQDLAGLFGVRSGTTGDILQHEAFGPRPTLAILVAENETTQALLGYAIWQDMFSTYRGARGIFIVDLYVAPAHRGEGIGALLLAQAARQASSQGASFMRLDVEAENESAARFYARLGFVEKSYRCFILDEPPFSALAAT